jgi:renalase
VLGVPISTMQATAHRWRYAMPETGVSLRDMEAWYDQALGLGVAGDWCVGGRVEGALASGMALAAQVRAAREPG